MELPNTLLDDARSEGPHLRQEKTLTETTGRLIETADIETSSEAYARRFAGEVGAYFLEIQAQTTLSLLEPWSGARVLDVGGGHAQIAVPLHEAGYRVTVTGSSSRCRSRLEPLIDAGRLRFSVCDCLSLPFARNAFDVVVAFRLLPHVTRWKRLIEEMTRVARYAVVVDYPDLRSFNLVSRAFFGWKKALEKNTRPFTCFTRGQLACNFATHGFEEASSRPEFFLPMVLHRAIGRAGVSRALESIAAGLGLRSLFGSPVILRVVAGSATALGNVPDPRGIGESRSE